jgi:hypothetical protein
MVVTDVNMYVTNVNMHVTDVNMHITDVNPLPLLFFVSDRRSEGGYVLPL